MTTRINGFQSRFTRLLLGLLLTLGANLASAEVLYVHTDHLGTPRLMTNEQGTTVWRNLPTTEPFGNSPVEEDPDGDATLTTLNPRFPGQYADRETNLNYNYFRDYDPGTGRYVQSDPIGLDGGINPYLYANANPLMYTDPEGLNPGLIRDRLAAALAAARAAKAGIEKGYNVCKNTRCKIAIHGPHHYFGWPFNQKMCHVQLNCWIKGVKGSKFVLRFPYSCDFPGAPAAGAGLLSPDEQDNGEGEE